MAYRIHTAILIILTAILTAPYNPVASYIYLYTAPENQVYIYQDLTVKTLLYDTDNMSYIPLTCQYIVYNPVEAEIIYTAVFNGTQPTHIYEETSIGEREYILRCISSDGEIEKEETGRYRVVEPEYRVSYIYNYLDSIEINIYTDAYHGETEELTVKLLNKTYIYSLVDGEASIQITPVNKLERRLYTESIEIEILHRDIQVDKSVIEPDKPETKLVYMNPYYGDELTITAYTYNTVMNYTATYILWIEGNIYNFTSGENITYIPREKTVDYKLTTYIHGVFYTSKWGRINISSPAEIVDIQHVKIGVRDYLLKTRIYSRADGEIHIYIDNREIVKEIEKDGEVYIRYTYTPSSRRIPLSIMYIDPSTEISYILLETTLETVGRIVLPSEIPSHIYWGDTFTLPDDWDTYILDNGEKIILYAYRVDESAEPQTIYREITILKPRIYLNNTAVIYSSLAPNSTLKIYCVDNGITLYATQITDTFGEIIYTNPLNCTTNYIYQHGYYLEQGISKDAYRLKLRAYEGEQFNPIIDGHQYIQYYMIDNNVYTPDESVVLEDGIYTLTIVDINGDRNVYMLTIAKVNILVVLNTYGDNYIISIYTPTEQYRITLVFRDGSTLELTRGIYTILEKPIYIKAEYGEIILRDYTS